MTARPAGFSASSSSDTKHAEVAKRVDIAATAIFNEMTVDDMSDSTSPTPRRSEVPGTPSRLGAQAWVEDRVLNDTAA